ncbi:UvrD-helicase domain-containing protein [Minwuia sp.]|uniref:UvrD-helicase domain-containing protein n=1 Tax=Minwuia sp. TaxID=2493630 RepID=UPI003A950984
MSDRIPTEADQKVAACLAEARSFALIAGAGSGKTTSLVDALAIIREEHGAELHKHGQRIACITYTNRAVEVIRSRLGFDELYNVTTLHSFLWGEIHRFQRDIREALQIDRIPAQIANAKDKDNGGASQTAIRARERAARLEGELKCIGDVSKFSYEDASFSDYAIGQLSHDDIIEISGYLLAERANFRRLLGARYPYIFVDEAQDTFLPIVLGLNLACADVGLPIVGYFGDPWQQIYEGRAGEFEPPEGGQTITKVENFRSAPEVINFLNAFRKDVKQVPAGINKDVQGSVLIRLVEAEKPEGRRNRYTDAQLKNALTSFDKAMEAWGWKDRDDVIQLFLVRQMIARRLGFQALNQLFTGEFASQRAQDDYESGEHYLLKPFVRVICPLIHAYRADDQRTVIDILRSSSPFYNTGGRNASRTLKEMVRHSKEHIEELTKRWNDGTVKDVLICCRNNELVKFSDRMIEQLAREPREQDYNDEEHSAEKGEWLADALFAMGTGELQNYCDFIQENTPYSTQHGAKGEEFADVLVVYDDIEAGWNLYNFTKLLTPQTAGAPTDGQRDRGRKLAYVSFSRAQENLRILLFTPNPEAAKKELIESGLFEEGQIELA